MDTVNFVADALGGLSPIPVVIAPGNHDFYSLGSPYNNDLLAARRQRPWPANVKILSRGTWEVFRLDRRADVSITGMAHAAATPIGDRLLSRPVPKDDAAAFNLLVFHGSREITELPRGKLRTLPFSDAELGSQGFVSAAIGLYHEAATISDGSGRVLGAYSGCPAGRGLDETGEKSVILGEISGEERGASPRVRLEHVTLDRRRIHLVEVPCTGLTHREAIFRRAEELLAVRDCRAEDIVCFRLTGRVSPGVDLRVPEGYLSDRFFHTAVDVSRLRPAYDLDRYRREEMRTTEARFAREMLRRMESASDPAERRLIENALYYGLDALIQKEVLPRYEE
jgi:DNA repair exonuclease SbcCD nuclease subunit